MRRMFPRGGCSVMTTGAASQHLRMIDIGAGPGDGRNMAVLTDIGC